MSERIEKTFAKVKAENRAALIPFIMGYDPTEATTAALLTELAGQGADLIEIGMPFSDPMADGPVIQAAGLRALAAGATLDGIFKLVREFRKKDLETPVILMGYYNPIYRYGNGKFCNEAQSAGVDGVIVVDLPPEEEGELGVFLKATQVRLIRLIAPTGDDTRIKRLCESAGGFVYYISVAGITGGKSADMETLKTQLARIRKATSLPIAVGFGIKTTDQVKQVAQVADAVVVGSALVETLHKAGGDATSAAGIFISELAKGLKR